MNIIFFTYSSTFLLFYFFYCFFKIFCNRFYNRSFKYSQTICTSCGVSCRASSVTVLFTKSSLSLLIIKVQLIPLFLFLLSLSHLLFCYYFDFFVIIFCFFIHLFLGISIFILLLSKLLIGSIFKKLSDAFSSLFSLYYLPQYFY
ncbi:unknown [Fusobacterium nucleatum subsp. nucleatum ATCC 25586]|uniref:Uncharacterized protein n=1 Tax=Fusobacterium nucleatum subsp. nucleatum (strain ATCC 25586 / DSM 15643 / BCRC 10681 / CIP 101130 / JCM 8532 / KCTC 2640 / LMG 13131 / VPI 4355) TaxID=190304 RepID=Q8RDZ6_FUSNN|nr:unknown [Fusobacterium nucleatum subsp. nucleatum ATCC 25586]